VLCQVICLASAHTTPHSAQSQAIFPRFPYSSWEGHERCKILHEIGRTSGDARNEISTSLTKSKSYAYSDLECELLPRMRTWSVTSKVEVYMKRVTLVAVLCFLLLPTVGLADSVVNLGPIGGTVAISPNLPHSGPATLTVKSRPMPMPNGSFGGIHSPVPEPATLPLLGLGLLGLLGLALRRREAL